MRDARITPIYEGTNGIQALDLLGRKVFGTGGKSVQMMAARIKEAIDKFGSLPEVTPLAVGLGKRVEQLGKLTMELGAAAMKNREEVGAAAADYLAVAGLCLPRLVLAGGGGRGGEEARCRRRRGRFLQGQARYGETLLRPHPAADRLACRGGARWCGRVDGAACRALCLRMTRKAAGGGSRLAAARRVVVKVGSALLVEKSTGNVNRLWLESLAQDIGALKARGQEVVLVSSGAIALGPARARARTRQAQARGEPGGRGRRPDPPRTCLEGSARAARLHRRAGAAHPE